MIKRLLPSLLLWAISASAYAGIFHDPSLNWHTIETEHFRFHYYDSEAALVQNFWPKAEAIYQETCAYLNWYPREKTEVVLTDEFDLANGYTMVFPYNNITLFVAAPDEINSLEDYNDWLALVFRHEFLHVIHLDKVRGAPQVLQKVFGRNPFLFPNAYQPRWVIEGLATYAETDSEQGVGRGQSSYYNMLIRTESLYGFKPIRRVNQPIQTWPAGDTPYLYGVFFFEFVHDRYGEVDIKNMVSNYSGYLIPFRINSNSESVFDKNLTQMWGEYQSWLKQKVTPVVSQIEQAGVHEGQRLTTQAYAAGSLHALGDKIYFYRFNGEAHPAIQVIDGERPARTLLEVNLHARFSVHPDKGLLIAQPEVCRNARLYYDLYTADADGRHYRRLTHCARYRNAIWNAKGDQIIAVKNGEGNNSLVLLNDKAEEIETLWQGKLEEQIGQLTSSPHQADIVATVWRPGKGWNLERFNLQNKTWTALTHDHAVEAQPQFTADGQHILYSADTDGVYNIYQYDLVSGQSVKLTNVLTGAFYPAMAGNHLAYIGYNIDGFDVYSMKAPVALKTGVALPVVKKVSTTEMLHGTSRPDVNEPITSEAKTAPVSTAKAMPADLPSRAYSPWKSLEPTWWMPYLNIDEQRTELGLTTGGYDALRRHIYSAQLAYDVQNGLPLGNINYVYDGLWPLIHLGYSRENTFYTGVNNTLARIRANDEAIIEGILPFYSFDRTITLNAALIEQFDTDVYDNGVTPWADTQNDMLGLAIRYISTKTYPLSVSRNDGRDVRLIYEDTDAFGNSDNLGQDTILDWREFIPVGGEHVLALRAVEGLATGNPSPFVLGGIVSPNNLLSTLSNGEVEPLFNVRNYSLRGYDQGEPQLIGENMQLGSVEYRFPIDRVEYGWMAPPFGFNQFSGTLFYDIGGVWNSGTAPQHYYTGAGFELTADIDLFYNIPLHTVIGYAKGFDKTIGRDVLYFRIGNQF